MKTHKQLTAEYREKIFPMGVLAVVHEATGRRHLEAGLNLPALENRLRFQLDLGGHPNRMLQAVWKRDGAAAFRFEVVETLEPRDKGEGDYRAEVQELLALCRERFSAYG